jgi:hypothetical protein
VTLCYAQESRLVSSWGLVSLSEFNRFVSLPLTKIVGLMSNIVDGIQRPLRVRIFIRCTTT